MSVSQAVLNSVAFDSPVYWRPTLIYVARWYIWAAFVPVVAWGAVRLSRFRGRIGVLLAAHALAALGVGIAHFAVEIVLLSILWTALIEPLTPAHFLGKLVGLRLSVNVLVYAMIASAVEAYRMAERHEAMREEASRLQRDLDEAHSAALAEGLVPHAMFNTLQALNGLVVSGRPDDASTMIARLGEWLRSLLDRPASPWSTVAEERDLAVRYLAVQQVRYGDRLRVEWYVAPEVASSRVPGWLLQPLVENAVKHAVAKTERPVTLELAIHMEEDLLCIRVQDDGPGGDAEAVGLGLSAIQRRLSVLYGTAATLTAHSHPGGGFVVIMRVPRTDP
ncbi:MAG: histidine kinase [Rubricoccaceae bacterium]